MTKSIFPHLPLVVGPAESFDCIYLCFELSVSEMSVDNPLQLELHGISFEVFTAIENCVSKV